METAGLSENPLKKIIVSGLDSENMAEDSYKLPRGYEVLKNRSTSYANFLEFRHRYCRLCLNTVKSKCSIMNELEHGMSLSGNELPEGLNLATNHEIASAAALDPAGNPLPYTMIYCGAFKPNQSKFVDKVGTNWGERYRKPQIRSPPKKKIATPLSKKDDSQ